MKISFSADGITVTAELAPISEVSRHLEAFGSPEPVGQPLHGSDVEEALKRRLLAALPALAELHQRLAADLLHAYVALLMDSRHGEQPRPPEPVRRDT